MGTKQILSLLNMRVQTEYFGLTSKKDRCISTTKHDNKHPTDVFQLRNKRQGQCTYPK